MLLQLHVFELGWQLNSLQQEANVDVQGGETRVLATRATVEVHHFFS